METVTRSGSLTLTVCSTSEELGAVRDEWEALAAGVEPAGIFATAAWHECWLRHIAPDATPAVAAMRNPSGSLVAVAPLCHWPSRNLGLTIPTLRFTGREVASGDYLDLVAAPDARVEATSLLLDHLAAALRRGALVLLGEIIRGGATDEALSDWIEREGFLVHRQEERQCPYFALAPTFDDYLGRLSSKTRAHLRRKARRIEDEADIEIRRLTSPGESADALPELFRLHALRWQNRGEAGNFTRPGFKEFITDLVRRPPASIRPNVYLMIQRDRAIASLLVFHTSRVAMHYQGGWDPSTDVAKHSPLLVLTSRSISDAIDARLSTFDFLRGDEPYKLDFAPSFRRTHTLLIAGAGLRARGLLVALKLKEVAKGALRRRPAATERPSVREP